MEATETADSDDLGVAPRAKRTRKESYEHLLGRLSHQSVVKHFDAYADIPWDDPDYQIVHDDPRWERSDDDTLGATDWYKAQPQSVRALIGLHSIVGHMRVGLVFESVLKRGLLEFAMTLPGSAPEFRYSYHEVIEEAQHSLMFNEFIQRSGLEVAPLPSRIQKGSQRVVSLGRTFPELFFIFVLGGEEPIDSSQRKVLGDRANLHPLIRRVMQIHVTEEARHLCFAKEYLRRQVPRLGRMKMLRLQLAAPVILSEMAKMMMQPPESVIRKYRVPAAVVDEAFTHNAAHKRSVHESLANVRDLCLELGVIDRRSVHLWKRMGIWPDDLAPN